MQIGGYIFVFTHHRHLSLDLEAKGKSPVRMCARFVVDGVLSYLAQVNKIMCTTPFGKSVPTKSVCL